MQTDIVSPLALAVPCLAFSGALMAQSPDVCVPDVEPAVPVALATVEPVNPILVTAAHLDCTTLYIRLTTGCAGDFRRCRCKVPKRDKETCVPQPVDTCRRNARQCKNDADRARKKCNKDKRGGG